LQPAADHRREDEERRAIAAWVVVPVERIELPTFGLQS